jgi:glyoxylase-like metal-dependent hydrolase (beta-lactamase superfamily II)
VGRVGLVGGALASGLAYCDLEFLGVPRIIATVVFYGPGGAAIIDPGPSSTLPALRAQLAGAGIAVADVRAVLLTHIHLDHAGATGTLVQANPSLRVYVHEKGAPHLVAPEKLIASATRLYGDDMDRLWGEFRPVPQDALVVLKGGERVSAGGRDLAVAYTPGHASHHVSYFSADTGIAFVGDTAGIRLQPGSFIMPPTPPPDIDLEAWRDSLRRIADWRADTIFVTHFGPHSPVEAHLTEMGSHLDLTASLVKASLARSGSDEDREQWVAEELRRELRRRMSESDALAYEVAGRFDLSWRGLARYWRKKEGIRQ